MLTGKTISELFLLDTVTEETSIPVQLNGVTYHIQYSAITDNVRHQGYRTKALGEYSHSEGTSFIVEDTVINTSTINYIDYDVEGVTHNGISSIILIDNTTIIALGDLSSYPNGEIVSLFIQNISTSFNVNLDYYTTPVIDTIEYNSDEDITIFTLSTPFESVYNNIVGKTDGLSSIGKYSHSEGFNNISVSESSHSEGGYNRSGCYGLYTNSIVDGVITINSNSNNFIRLTESFGEGKKYILFDDKLYSDNFGHGVLEYSTYTFDGSNIIINLIDTTFNSTGGLIGTTTKTNYLFEIYFQHSEGINTFAFGSNSHSEGKDTISLGDNSHSEGVSTSSNGIGSHSEGDHTHANGEYSHSEGFESISNGIGSHAEGRSTIANGDYSHSEGYRTIAQGDYQQVSGKYNTTGDTTSLLIVGNGTSSERGDSFKVYPISDSLSTILIPQAVDLDYPNDTIAFLRGVPVGGVYHTDGTIKLRRNVVEKPHTFFIQSNLSGSSNWNYSILDYSNKTIKGPIDTNIPSGSTFNITSLTNSGYQYILYSGGNILTNIFLNLLGDVMETYTASTENYENDCLQGKYLTLNDSDNKIFKYSDGLLNVKTINYNDYFRLQYSLDSANLNGFVCFSGDTNGNRDCLFINMDTIITLTNYDSTIYELNSYLYVNGDFILLSYFNIDTQTYDMFEIYSYNGDLLQQEDVSTMNLNYIDFNAYGTNKTTIIFYNNGNSNVNYLIYNYDGETDTLINTTHQRGSNYFSKQIYSIKNFGPTQTKSENSFIIFYSGYNLNNLTYVSYSDILPIFSGDTEFREPYVFQSSGLGNKSLGIDTAALVNDYSFIIPCVSGDGYLSLFTVKPNGYSFINVCPINSINNNNIITYQLRNYFGIIPYTVYDTQGNFYIYNNNGDFVDAQSLSNASSPLTIESDLDTVFIKYDLNGYYFNSVSGGFNIIPSGQNYNQVYKSTTFTTENGLNVGNLFIFNSTNKIGRLITPTGITNQVVFYNSSAFTFNVNSNFVIHTYKDGSNKYNLSMYDLSLNVIKTITTNEGTLVSVTLYDDRLLLITSSAGKTYNYLITTDTTKSVVVGLSNNQLANDYITWY